MCLVVGSGYFKTYLRYSMFYLHSIYCSVLTVYVSSNVGPKTLNWLYGNLLYLNFKSFIGNGNTSFSNSGRILISTWWIFTIVVLATYSGNLVAVLSVTLEEAPFNTFEGLVEQDQYKWGTLGGTIYLSIMEVFKAVFIAQ